MGFVHQQAAHRGYSGPYSAATRTRLHISHTADSTSRLTSQCHSSLETLPQSARRAVLSSQFIDRAVIFARAQVFLFPCIKTGVLFRSFGKKSRSLNNPTDLMVSAKRRRVWRLTFCSSLEENLAAAAGEGTVVAAWGLVGADQAGPLWWEEELHGVRVVSGGLKSAARYTGWDGRADTEAHVKERKPTNKLLILCLLIFIPNRSFYTSKVEMNRKVEMFVFNLFFVLPLRLIACLRHKNISSWAPSIWSTSRRTFYLLTAPADQVLFPRQTCAKASEPDLNRAESVMTEDGVGTI